ncbi:MAG: sortase family protein [Candidatus Saccharibacteria bacterium]|nr:sortase family protein [Candidatus Saccharibacteria bacterium]
MSPDENQTTPANTPAAPQQSPSDVPASQAAAANIVRAQIENIYSHPSDQPASAEPAQQDNPYERTHEDNPQPVLEQWKQYHSAWQTYYQKYYEGYYTHHLERAKQTIQSQPTPVPTTREAVFTHQAEQERLESTSQDEALFDLRQKLLSRVTESAKKVRKSRHFVPITAAVLVVLIFAFLQYNQLLIGTVMAYVSPGNIDPQNIVIDPSSNVSVPADPLLIIPKINVDVPVLYDVGNDYNSQMAAMAKGVAQFAIPGASSHPGQVGNTVLAGHSSNDLLDGGDYKFIFAQLDKLEVGDSIYVNYQSIRYTYTVTKKQVVEPTDVSALVYQTTQPVLTLLTCTPVGTALHRLLITAQQVSPDPTASTAAPTTSTNQATTEIPGSSPTLFERLFGG